MDFKLKKSNLNFRVYTATEPPETGNENDICVISSVPMKNWILSPDTPTGKPRNSGDVHVEYSVNRKDVFNALKNSAMMIEAIAAKQYVDGAWVDVFAKIYHDGAWIDLDELAGKGVWLYKDGDECEDITGGWEFTQGREQGYGSYIKGTDSITLSATQTGVTSQAVTANAIDLTGYSKLKINIVESNVGFVYFKFGTSQVMGNGTRRSNSLPVGEHSLNIADISGSYYVALEAYSNGVESYAGSVTFNRIWLEK